MKEMYCPACLHKLEILNEDWHGDFEVTYHSFCNKCKLSIKVFQSYLPNRPEVSD